MIYEIGCTITTSLMALPAMKLIQIQSQPGTINKQSKHSPPTASQSDSSPTVPSKFLSKKTNNQTGSRDDSKFDQRRVVVACHMKKLRTRAPQTLTLNNYLIQI